MNQISFVVQRYPCIPKPCARKALAAKSTILSRGGCFYRFSIDGCSSVVDLEKYLQEKLGLGEGALLAAIDRMSEVADQEMGLKVKDVWGIVEKNDDIETITFTGLTLRKKSLKTRQSSFLPVFKSLRNFWKQLSLQAGA